MPEPLHMERPRLLADDHPRTTELLRGPAAGALGYVLQLSAGNELVPAVRAALRGVRYVGLRLASPCATPAA